MSYIAKIYLNKMFPKKGDNGIKIDGDNLVIPCTVVINPIKVIGSPENLNDSFQILGDGTIIAGKDKPDVYDKVKIVAPTITITSENGKDLDGASVALGDIFQIIVPNTLGWAAGESHSLTMKIIQENPIQFTIKRTIL